MNEIKKYSISGVAFTLDKEAYETLENYLNGLHEAYRHSADGPEIVADIEARIAELILSVQDGGQVVEKPLILNIIDQLGHIEELSGEQQENGGAREDDDLHPADRIPRRLYRDPENAKLGGVCAGLGKYFDIDPVWIRLGLFVPLFLKICLPASGFFFFLSTLSGNLAGVFFLCYLVLWFAIPSARSARQKLEMEGTPVTVRNVAQTAMAANETDSKAKPIIAETVSVFGKVVLILLKLFAGFVVLGLIITACAFIIGLISILIGGPELLDIPIWLTVLAILVVLIPNLLLIYVLMCLIASRKPGGRTIWTSLILWVLTIIACLITAFRTLPDEWYNLSDLSQWSLNFQGSVNGGIHVIKEPQPDMEDLQRQLQAGEPAPGTDSTVRTPAAPAEPTVPAQPAEPADPSAPVEP